MSSSVISTTRPLSILSDFVVEELPIILNEIDSDKAQLSLTRKTEKLTKIIENQAISDNVLSLLDLTFLEAAFYANNLEIPESLISLTDTC